jgi:hypothetical protein
MSRNLFNELNSDEAGDRQRLTMEEDHQFEHERVKFTLQQLKLGHQTRQVGKIWADAHGGKFELRFAAFNELFPTFPFLMGASRLRGIQIVKNNRVVRTTPHDYHVHRDPASAEPSRFKDFAGVPFRAAYEQFFNSVGIGDDPRDVCLVFPRKGFLHGMCIHNNQSEQYWTEGLCWVYKSPKTSVRLYVQPFKHFIEAIHGNGRGWKP